MTTPQMCMRPLAVPRSLLAPGQPAGPGRCGSTSARSSSGGGLDTSDRGADAEEEAAGALNKRPDGSRLEGQGGDDGGCARLPAVRLESRKDGAGWTWRVLSREGGGRGVRAPGYVLLEQVNGGVHQKAHMAVLLGAPFAPPHHGQEQHLQQEPPFLGPDPTTRVVIKMIRRSWLRRMLRDGTGPGELAALERLSTAPAHPNVVPLIEAVADEHFLYLVFPFCEGGEMFELVAAAGVEGGMAEGEARACFAQVVAGLLHLKGLGMTHGDLSLENVVLTPNGAHRPPTCHLIDLEMARLSDDWAADWATSTKPLPQQPSSSAAGSCVGFKPGYVPPEVAAHVATDWHAADVWSLGICLYTMLTGRPLYLSPRDETFALLAKGQAPELVHYYDEAYGHRVPQLAADLICRMLHPAPAQRPTLEEITSHPWLLSLPVPWEGPQPLDPPLSSSSPCWQEEEEARAVAPPAAFGAVASGGLASSCGKEGGEGFGHVHGTLESKEVGDGYIFGGQGRRAVCQ